MAAGEQFMRLDSAATDKALATLAEFTGKPVADIIRERAVMFARYLATATPPFTTLPGPLLPNQSPMLDGGGRAARFVGRSAVARDIRRVYANPRDIYQQLRDWSAKATGRKLAAAFWGALKRGDFAQAKEVLTRAGISAKNLDIIAWDDGALHKSKRTPRGRINRGTRPAIVANSAKLKAYTQKVQDRVGFTKSAWITAASQISTVGLGQISSWILGNAGPGYGEDATRNTQFPTVRLTNAVPWINQTIPENFLITAAKSFEVNLAAELQKAADYWVKKSGLQLAA